MRSPFHDLPLIQDNDLIRLAGRTARSLGLLLGALLGPHGKLLGGHRAGVHERHRDAKADDQEDEHRGDRNRRFVTCDRLAHDIPTAVALGFNRFAREQPLDILAQRHRRLIAAFGGLFEGLQDDRIQFIADPSGQGTRPLRHDIGDRSNDLGDRPFGGIGVLAGERAVEHDAKRVDVGSRVGQGRITAQLLGRREGERPEKSARLGQGRVRRTLSGNVLLRHAEVEYVRFAGRVDQNVSRLEIAVNHAALVCVADRIANLHEQAQNAVGRRPRFLDELIEWDTLDMLHHKVRHVVDRRPAVIHADDVRMTQARHQLDLALEPPPAGRRMKRRFQQHLDRHAAIRRTLRGRVDRPLSAARQLAQVVIARDLRQSAFGPPALQDRDELALIAIPV